MTPVALSGPAGPEFQGRTPGCEWPPSVASLGGIAGAKPRRRPAGAGTWAIVMASES